MTLRGGFWRAPLDDQPVRPAIEARTAPRVHAVIPARDEADVIGVTAASLLGQVYDGALTITVVDDRSTDGTAAAARGAAARAQRSLDFAVIEARPLAEGWTGKLWALAQGVAYAREAYGEPDYWWFTDADVEHDPTTLARLTARARHDGLDLVSLMVRLHRKGGWETLLVPAFVFFFQKLYPFAWVNDRRRATAAAAGGCVLLSAGALRRIGGLEAIAGRLIDDCALAAAVKRSGGWIRLGLTARSRSIRPYHGLRGIWSMVARTAYTQLDHSPWQLLGTVAGMKLLYVVPPLAMLYGALARKPRPLVAGATAWTLQTIAYVPTLRRYRVPPVYALTLPFAAVLYTAMTVDSALRHARGAGGGWKGRTYGATVPPAALPLAEAPPAPVAR